MLYVRGYLGCAMRQLFFLFGGKCTERVWVNTTCLRVFEESRLLISFKDKSRLCQRSLVGVVVFEESESERRTGGNKVGYLGKARSREAGRRNDGGD